VCSVFNEAVELLPRRLRVAFPLDSQLNHVFVFNPSNSVASDTVNTIPAALVWLKLFLSRKFFFGSIILSRNFSLPISLRPRITFAEILRYHWRVFLLGPLLGFEAGRIFLLYFGLNIIFFSDCFDHFTLALLWLALIERLGSLPGLKT